ncbi:mitochondrial carrier protein [Cryptococcus wingfieldii CBS 7118]|uniref:Mitochondrial carrier protein n=1 Tax=Cryptococcus wingfieldii CBS 7118 TaxID=1295528 RepID=A0A1E3HPD4_9TREE|nr:mitochondrial carrier protein [Cryptococcus wingfieldii CBS 7118]ODN78187.1 mitochondrial carrier protein [Cryptococcus wingfieldii CBS 7118]
MESFVDVLTTVFQAVLAVNVVFLGGYAYNGRHLPALSKNLSNINKGLLLPLLLLTGLAASSTLTWKTLLQSWPLAIIALTTHIASLAISIGIHNYFKTPEWTVEALTFNNVSSYPLLVLWALYKVSPEGGLGHLHWRIRDTNLHVLERASLYILINILITNVFRNLLKPVVSRYTSPPLIDEPADRYIPLPAGESTEEEEATERTSLLSHPSPSPSPSTSLETGPKTSFKLILRSPIVLAAVVGLAVGLVKPLQRGITGVGAGGAGEGDGTWLWLGIGSGLVALGQFYPLFDVFTSGVTVRAGHQVSQVTPPPHSLREIQMLTWTRVDRSEEEPVPPTLGTVLILSAWRYAAIPAITLPIVKGLRHIPSTKVFLQDPAFSFVLALTVITPPLIPSPSPLTPFKSSSLFHTSLTSLLSSLPLTLALAIPAHGISYDLNFDLLSALKSAAGGGVAGAAAMVVQVLTLMPMRTVMNYQYRFGGGIKHATKTLYEDGGLKRYYAGLAAALFQGPLSRFGDTAANAGILALLSTLPWPILLKTIAASLASACFRMLLTPIDTIKTTQQTQGGKAGWGLVRERVRERGVGSLWWGAGATAAATFVGHYPWFGTYNYLSTHLPLPTTLPQKLIRQAFIGFSASLVSDTSSNSLRVLKTYRQTHPGDVGYVQAAREVVAAEGLWGLFGRGLGTRLITNGLQGLLFSVLWKLFADM